MLVVDDDALFSELVLTIVVVDVRLARARRRCPQEARGMTASDALSRG
jgi:hypothetical protein